MRISRTGFLNFINWRWFAFSIDLPYLPAVCILFPLRFSMARGFYWDGCPKFCFSITRKLTWQWPRKGSAFLTRNSPPPFEPVGWPKKP